jgi:curved DNA-binding protein CbpA
MSTKPTAQGTLGKTPFGHLLLYAHDRHLTGTLAIWPEQNAEGGRGQDRLFIQDGAVVAARTLQACSSCYDAVVALFARVDGPYGFYADQNLLGSSEDVLRGTIDTYTALSRGLRAHARESVIDGVLLKIGPRAVRVRKGLPVERLDLPSAQRALVEHLQSNKASLDDLMRHKDVSPHDVRRLLYLLTLIRGIETAEDHAALGGLTMETMPPAPEGRAAPSEPTAKAEPVEITRPRVSLYAPPSSGARNAPSAPAPNTGTMSLPAPPPPPNLAHQDVARWSEIAGTFDKLDELTHYQLLGVAQNASTVEINNAYFSQVKKFHPDRLPAGFGALARCAQILFDRLTEANATLSSPETRVEYNKAVEEGGGTRAAERMMRNVLDSTLDFQKAEVMLKRRDFTQALQHVRSALAKNPDEPDYHALYAWILHLMNPADPAPTDEMLVSLERALKANPNSERAHYYRGVVLKRLKRDREALHHFRKALEINPRNVDAAREVRLAGMRRDSKPPPPGLLSKLFKGGKDGA